MKTILVGYPGSQRIVPASKYLTEKYLVAGNNWLPSFEIIYLNYKGDISGWADYIYKFLEYFEDRYVVFALDDYLLSGKIDMGAFAKAWDELHEDHTVCAKLCQSTPQEHDEYPVTTQYCIWNRRFLMWLLAHVKQPWEFELKGSELFKMQDKKVIHRPCLEYFTNSSISSRWEGVRLDGLKQEDIDYIKQNNLICQEDIQKG